MESNIIKGQAVEASERIRLAIAQIDVAGEACRTGESPTAALDLCSQRLTEARTQVDALIVAIQGEPEPAMRACPSCGKSIRSLATLCGYCWTKSAPC